MDRRAVQSTPGIMRLPGRVPMRQVAVEGNQQSLLRHSRLLSH